MDFFLCGGLFLCCDYPCYLFLYSLLSEGDDKMMLPVVEAVRHAEPIVAAY